MFPNNSPSHNLNFYVTNYECDSGMKDLYDQKRNDLCYLWSGGGMSRGGKLISALGHAEGACIVLPGRPIVSRSEGGNVTEWETPSWDAPGAACTPPSQGAASFGHGASALSHNMTFLSSAS